MLHNCNSYSHILVPYLCVSMCQMLVYWVGAAHVLLSFSCKTSRWLGLIFRMLNDTSPKKPLFGEVKGLCPPDCPTSSFNDDVVLRDCQNCSIKLVVLNLSWPYWDAHNRVLWRDSTWVLPCTSWARKRKCAMTIITERHYQSRFIIQKTGWKVFFKKQTSGFEALHLQQRAEQ